MFDALNSLVEHSGSSERMHAARLRTLRAGCARRWCRERDAKLGIVTQRVKTGCGDVAHGHARRKVVVEHVHVRCLGFGSQVVEPALVVVNKVFLAHAVDIPTVQTLRHGIFKTIEAVIQKQALHEGVVALFVAQPQIRCHRKNCAARIAGEREVVAVDAFFSTMLVQVLGDHHALLNVGGILRLRRQVVVDAHDNRARFLGENAAHAIVGCRGCPQQNRRRE